MIEILDKANCSGCAACAGVCPKACIEMKEDNEGFAYPVIDERKCIQCGACDRVCPVLNLKDEKSFEQTGYIVQNKDKEVLRESTAGGAFTAIARYVTEKGGVIFGVALDSEFLPYHTYVEDEKELCRFRNSKYVQSFIGADTYKQVKSFLEQGRMVCFSGTPCQIEGLNSFLKKKYENLITVDVVCRAVPSRLVYRKYLDLLRDNLNDNILTVRFRDKHYGYKYSTMNIVTEKNKGNYHKGVESDPWLRAFFSNMCNRPSCYSCKFRRRHHNSDFTIWDCFNVGRFSKKLDNDKGATRVLINTEAGRHLFSEICGQFDYVEIEPDKLTEGVAEMFSSVEKPQKRERFFADAEKMGSEELFKKYFPVTMRVRLEHFVRMLCYRLGIYSVLKKVFVKITHKY